MRTQQHGIVRYETERERHFEHFHHLDSRMYRVCVLHSCPLQKAAVEPSTCAGEGPEPETLEADAAPVSRVGTRATIAFASLVFDTFSTLAFFALALVGCAFAVFSLGTGCLIIVPHSQRR